MMFMVKLYYSDVSESIEHQQSGDGGNGSDKYTRLVPNSDNAGPIK